MTDSPIDPELLNILRCPVAVHYDDAAVHIFHESCGYQRFAVLPVETLEPARVAARLIASLKLKP